MSFKWKSRGSSIKDQSVLSHSNPDLSTVGRRSSLDRPVCYTPDSSLLAKNKGFSGRKRGSEGADPGSPIAKEMSKLKRSSDGAVQASVAAKLSSDGAINVSASAKRSSDGAVRVVTPVKRSSDGAIQVGAPAKDPPPHRPRPKPTLVHDV